MAEFVLHEEEHEDEEQTNSDHSSACDSSSSRFTTSFDSELGDHSDFTAQLCCQMAEFVLHEEDHEDEEQTNSLAHSESLQGLQYGSNSEYHSVKLTKQNSPIGVFQERRVEATELTRQTTQDQSKKKDAQKARSNPIMPPFATTYQYHNTCVPTLLPLFPIPTLLPPFPAYYQYYNTYIPTLLPPFPIPTLQVEPSFSAASVPPFQPSLQLQAVTLLRHKIATQIEYYFCDENLSTDIFLKNRMDEEGWVPISLIAGFKRVLALSKDTQFVLQSLIYADSLEVKGEKVRRRDNWKKWLPDSPKQ